eukprot:TRINITY_DN22255_c0_g1_i1.p1 TRINITY_DN22255_c0_g1~~TRINITY_DN22255_c0_g1_i1.p1  ORF type:complete len:851 (+),score=157.85 TRINITY_DN22255_c0_g1_i1:112-2553(+)
MEGEEKLAVVVDVGTETVKAGFAGVAPTFVKPSCQYDPDTGERLAVLRRGEVASWDRLRRLWDKVFHDLAVDPAKFRVFQVVPTSVTDAVLRQAAQLLFTEFAVQEVSFGDSASLCASYADVATGIIVESGAGSTVVSAVCGGDLVPGCTRTVPIGGDDVTELVGDILFGSTELRACASFKHLAELKARHGRVDPAGGDADAETKPWPTAPVGSGLLSAVRSPLSARPINSESGCSSGPRSMQTPTTKLSPARAVSRALEVFFAPDAIPHPSAESGRRSVPQPLHRVVVDVAEEAARRAAEAGHHTSAASFLADVVVAGGNALAEGFTLRLEQEVANCTGVPCRARRVDSAPHLAAWKQASKLVYSVDLPWMRHDALDVAAKDDAPSRQLPLRYVSEVDFIRLQGRSPQELGYLPVVASERSLLQGASKADLIFTPESFQPEVPPGSPEGDQSWRQPPPPSRGVLASPPGSRHEVSEPTAGPGAEPPMGRPPLRCGPHQAMDNALPAVEAVIPVQDANASIERVISFHIDADAMAPSTPQQLLVAGTPPQASHISTAAGTVVAGGVVRRGLPMATPTPTTSYEDLPDPEQRFPTYGDTGAPIGVQLVEAQPRMPLSAPDPSEAPALRDSHQSPMATPEGQPYGNLPSPAAHSEHTAWPTPQREATDSPQHEPAEGHPMITPVRRAGSLPPSAVPLSYPPTTTPPPSNNAKSVVGVLPEGVRACRWHTEPSQRTAATAYREPSAYIQPAPAAFVDADAALCSHPPPARWAPGDHLSVTSTQPPPDAPPQTAWHSVMEKFLANMATASHGGGVAH